MAMTTFTPPHFSKPIFQPCRHTPLLRPDLDAVIESEINAEKVIGQVPSQKGADPGISQVRWRRRGVIPVTAKNLPGVLKEAEGECSRPSPASRP